MNIEFMTENALGLVSVLFGSVSILWAIVESRRRIRLSRVIRIQLGAIVTEVGVHVPSQERLREYLEGVEKPELSKWVWQKHQFMCGLYRDVVTHYLTTTHNFDFTDLKRLVENDAIKSRWEEMQWRSQLALEKSPPNDEGYFVKKP